MITVPKPRFAKTNVPIGVSLEDYRDQIADLQFHILGDAIDRVSRRNRDVVVKYPIYRIHIWTVHILKLYFICIII